MDEVGDVVRLSITTTDATGTAVDVAGVAVSVTLPDGTSASALPAVQHPAVGSYFCDYPTVQAGRHFVRWAGTGFAQSDPLNVWPLDPRFLITLDDAKRSLSRSSRRSSIDEDLRLYIAAVTPVIEDITGPLVRETRTKTVPGGVGSILLPGPVQSATVAVDGYPAPVYVDKAAGIVRTAAGVFGTDLVDVVVTYVVGESVIPPNLLLAAREELRFLWTIGQQAMHPGMGDDSEDTEYTPSGFAVPRRVIELCAAHPRFGGFA